LFVGVIIAGLDTPMRLKATDFQHARVMIGPHFDFKSPQPTSLRVLL